MNQYINIMRIMKHKRKTLTFLMMLVGVTTTVFAQQGFGINKPDASAAVDITSTTQGFLPPRMTDAQIAAIVNPAEGLMVYNTTQHCLAVYSSGAFKCAYSAPWTCGFPLVVTHTAGSVAPVTKTVTYGTVYTGIGGSGNKCWITQNLGAAYQAYSYADGTESAAGWYWQFGRTQGYMHDGTTRTPATAWNTVPDPDTTPWAAAKDPCTLLLGTGWRIPTSTEWVKAMQALGLGTVANVYSNFLKLHTSGYLNSTTGAVDLRWRGAADGASQFWTSTPSAGSPSTSGRNVAMGADFTNFIDFGKTWGCPLRCICD
jgi:hypothetical protein